MKHSSKVTCIFALVLLYNFCQAQQQDRTPQINKVNALLEQYYQKNSPGVALAIIEHGQTIYSAQKGISDMEYGISITDSTAFHIASVSKQFTAFIAVSLEREGKLSLDDNVTKYLPELKELPYKITLRQLANHTHGLPNLYEIAQLRGIEPADQMSHKEVVDMLLHIRQVNFKPGEKFEYNNTGFVLLAEIIERICEKPFQDVLNERIFNPLQMTNSLAVSTSAVIIKNKAQSYRLKNGKYENFPFNLMANGSSGISTTIKDLTKWVINMQYPSVKDSVILDEMIRPTRLNSGTSTRYGLGLESKTYKGLEIVFHGGGDAGYRSYILNVPKYNFSVVILGNNNDFKPFQLIYEIVDLFLMEHEQKAPSPLKTIYTTKELERFSGTYEMFPGSLFNIIAENNALYYQAFGTEKKMQLPVVGDGVFANPNLPISYFVFANNTCTFHIADFNYPSKRVNLSPPNPNEINLSKFVGLYKNVEFNTEYELLIKDNKLIAKHSFNHAIMLHPLTKNTFYSDEGFFGELIFLKNTNGKIIGFTLSGQNLYNLQFIKIK